MAGDPLRSIPRCTGQRADPCRASLCLWHTRQPLVSAAPETAPTKKLSCGVGLSPAAELWHEAREALAFAPLAQQRTKLQL